MRRWVSLESRYGTWTGAKGESGFISFLLETFSFACRALTTEARADSPWLMEVIS